MQQGCFQHPPSSQGIITINHTACFFITSYNGHCMSDTYWLAIGSGSLFISHSGTCPPVFNICLSCTGSGTGQLEWTRLHRAKWHTWSAINWSFLWLKLRFPFSSSRPNAMKSSGLIVFVLSSTQFDAFILYNIVHLVHPFTPSSSFSVLQSRHCLTFLISFLA